MQAEKEDFHSIFDEKMTSPYFSKYVPNFQDRIYRKPKYTFARILDIVFKHEPRILNHIKQNVIKIVDKRKTKLSFKEKLKLR